MEYCISSIKKIIS
ncbi:hypothetical protein Mgra_00008350 [Meloidogyne graminicola]|uniref:Uncharacterized protein n=1 Tax=Meloidogyne graminicola TaxID=189291 RepID=A0A8S9ZG39_9BILA|nr:hypothetical protein Mgra_00008350 [Meloidogyne graminicola]